MKPKSTIYKFLFPSKFNQTYPSLFLLASRIVFGIMFMNHGIQKILNFDQLSTTFTDPLHIGSFASLSLAIFAEVLCATAFIFGILYRLSMIPMIFTMVMAFFVIHGGDAFADRELSLLYLFIFILLYIAGPGKYSADTYIANILHN